MFEPTTLPIPPPAFGPPPQCSSSMCRKPASLGFKTCEKCREQSRISAQNKRKHDKEEDMASKRLRPDHGPQPTSAEVIGVDSDSDSTADSTERARILSFENAHSFFEHLERIVKNPGSIDVFASFFVDEDPLKTDRDRVRWTADQIHKVTGYRFRVHKNLNLKTGSKTQHFCCQDAHRIAKSKLSTNSDAKPRHRVGMKRFKCQSRLNITSRQHGAGLGKRLVTVNLRHLDAHIPYPKKSIAAPITDYFHKI